MVVRPCLQLFSEKFKLSGWTLVLSISASVHPCITSNSRAQVPKRAFRPQCCKQHTRAAEGCRDNLLQSYWTPKQINDPCICTSQYNKPHSISPEDTGCSLSLMEIIMQRMIELTNLSVLSRGSFLSGTVPRNWHEG